MFLSFCSLLAYMLCFAPPEVTVHTEPKTNYTSLILICMVITIVVLVVLVLLVFALHKNRRSCKYISFLYRLDNYVYSGLLMLTVVDV